MPACTPRDASAQETALLCERLVTFNRTASSQNWAEAPVRLALHDEHGNVQAGLLADICAGWLNLHVLWVEPACRGQGLGTTLLAEAEQRARSARAAGVLLDTFDWQAEGFYLRHGYEVFGRLDDYPPGHQRVYMRKSLR
jgi:ribosomal protein S18 acetylase RimI-like enzyme